MMLPVFPNGSVLVLKKLMTLGWLEGTHVGGHWIIFCDCSVAGDSYRDVACRWLRANEDLWRSWLPDPTACYAQFGLYHLTSRQFVKDREDMRNLVCKACPSGTYSKKLVDKKGLTNICESCPIGTAQASGASLACEPCNSGYYQDINGSASCKRCGIGKYQDGEGEDGCKPCPVGTTTLGFGSKSSSDCVCHEHYINVETEHTAVAKCMACTEGLHCPLGSSLESLKSGYSDIGEAYTPSLEKGESRVVGWGWALGGRVARRGQVVAEASLRRGRSPWPSSSVGRRSIASLFRSQLLVPSKARSPVRSVLCSVRSDALVAPSSVVLRVGRRSIVQVDRPENALVAVSWCHVPSAQQGPLVWRTHVWAARGGRWPFWMDSDERDGQEMSRGFFTPSDPITLDEL